MKSSLALLALALPLAACPANTVVPDTGDDVQNENTLVAKPYGSRQIRQAMPIGSRITIRNEKGTKVTLDDWQVIDADKEFCTMLHQITDESGKVLEDLGEDEYSWNELRDHASFAVDRTVRSEGHIDVPVGSYDTWLYVVTDQNDDGVPKVTYYHFAKELPGPPVLMTEVVDGKLVLTRTMVGRK